MEETFAYAAWLSRCAVRVEIRIVDPGCSYGSNDFGEQRARLANIGCRLAALDRGEDRLQQRAGMRPNPRRTTAGRGPSLRAIRAEALLGSGRCRRPG